ncbi:MAG: UDP-glucose 4-epimerase GalE [Actinomycetota bacterium]|nr:UDP-glucose 4-epimerase GalE [Actinomycetota bacterium]
MHVLVTGGAGYIGSVVAARLLEEGHEVTVLDDLSTGHADAVPDGARLVEGRVHDAARLLASLHPDAVAHLAAFSLVAESVEAPGRYEENNVVGTRRLLEAMHEAGIGRLVFSSTAAVYGEPATVPIEETAPTRPLNPYGRTKLAMDEALARSAREGGLAAVSLRYFNVAGAYAGRGERHRTETHLIPLTLDAAVGRREELAVYGTDYATPDGTCIRDYVHVADIADAHLLALAAAVPGRHDVVNLGNGTGFSVLDVVAAVERATGRRVPLRHADRRLGDPAVLVASAARAGQLLGWHPARPSLDTMVADAYALRAPGATGPGPEPPPGRPGARRL